MKVTVIVILIVLTLQFMVVNCFFRSQAKKLKNRAREFYHKHIKKNKTRLTGQDPSFYPGLNPQERLENQKIWNEYYKCLAEQESSYSENGNVIPEAIQGFEGGHIKLSCKFCLSPMEEERRDLIEWYFGEIGKDYLSIIFYSEHILLSPEDNTLHIYNLNNERSGQYVCIMGDSATAPYYLNVVAGDNQIEQVQTSVANHGPYPKAPEFLTAYNLNLTTEWGDWSECSTCKIVGKRHRLGYCNVVYSAAANVSRRSFWHEAKHALLNESYTFKKPLTKSKKLKSEEVLPNHLELIKIFQYGIPCKSYILPRSVAQLPQVIARKDEVMVGYCKVKCKNDQIFVVKDKRGNEIERANNSAGIYSTLQGIPPTTPQVERLVQYERGDTDVILTCPGNLNSDASVKWLREGKEIIAEVIYEESKGRMYISLLERIHIKKAKISDSNLYSCWQHNELAGTVRLIVENKIKLQFNHHIMLIGMILILSVFVYVFFKAFTNRKLTKDAR